MNGRPCRSYQLGEPASVLGLDAPCRVFAAFLLHCGLEALSLALGLESLRAIAIAGLDELARASDINYSRWKNIRHKTVRISSEELDVLVKMFPGYAL